MQIVPTQPVPAQIINIVLANQATTISIYQKSTGLFIDVYVNTVLVIGGVICENFNRIVRSLYLGFVGDLAFIDNEGNTDPVYTGLGSRYSLAYLEAADLPPGQG